ncbi:MAG: peptidyl-prolyl cis-trans isomerase [Proteobacteria bacterium]|nr:peptidyl-prolyl cis-trans isomerase [Pseudomonadota bacterium]
MSPLTLLKSPLVHFFVIGGGIFALYAVLNGGSPASPPNTISLSRQEATRLSREFKAAQRRPATASELTALMRNWAKEEASVRDALALGLDQGDPVIRQRLSLKMQLLAESDAASLVPDDATLASYLAEHRDRFERPLRIAFTQILLAPEMATNVVATRAAVEAGADPVNFSQTSLLPPSVLPTPAPAIDGIFGPGFAAALEGLPTGRWAGPIKSRFGLHLVRVTERSPAALPSLQDIRERVESEWRADQARQMREAYGEELLRRYSIGLPAAEDVLGR